MTTLYSQDTCPSNCSARAIHNQLAAKKDRGKGLSVFCPRKRLLTISPMQEIVVHAPTCYVGTWQWTCRSRVDEKSEERSTWRTRTQKRSDESITVIGTKMGNNYCITMRKHYVGLYVLKLYHADNKRVMTWETVFRYIVPLLLHVCSDHWINETQFWHVSKMFSHVTAISLTFSMRSFSLDTSTHAASWISQLSLQTFSLLMPRWWPLFVYSASQTFITILRA